MPFSIQHIHNQTIGVYDSSASMYYEFDIPNEKEEVILYKKIKFADAQIRIIKTNYDQYIGLSMLNGLFIMSDSTGQTVNSFFEYPYKNESEHQLENKYRAFGYQGTFAVNPSKTKFSYSTFYGEVIHFYDIEKDNIKLISKIENEYPLYKKRDDDVTGVIVGTESLIGYLATFATDRYVYALFSGKKAEDKIWEARTLRIFDWNGILTKEYELDVPSSYLCVSDDDSKLWTVASNPDSELVYFDLENITENNQYNKMNGIVDQAVENNTVFTNSEFEYINNIKTYSLNIGKIPINKTITTNLIIPNHKIISATTNSKDIILKDSVTAANQTTLLINISKSKQGFFSDTIHVFLDTYQHSYVYSGEAISD
jgi:hypothetical protein